MMRNLTQLTFGTLLLALLPLCGCEQGLGGGAYTPSTVTLIVSGTGSSTGGSESPETAGPAAVAGFGTVKGKVVIDGSAPALAMLVQKGNPPKPDDALCAVNGVPNESVIADANGGLANVFIFLKKVPKGVVIHNCTQSGRSRFSTRSRFGPRMSFGSAETVYSRPPTWWHFVHCPVVTSFHPSVNRSCGAPAKASL